MTTGTYNPYMALDTAVYNPMEMWTTTTSTAPESWQLLVPPSMEETARQLLGPQNVHVQQYVPAYAGESYATTASSSVVTEDSINALIDKRFDERLAAIGFDARLRIKYPKVTV